ncbi:PTS transporter subunit EIIC [Bacillus pacificus]
MIRFLEKYVMPVAGKVAEQRHLLAIRDGLVLTMPFLIIGSIFLIISTLPIPGYSEFMASLFGKNWNVALGYPVSATFNIMALIAVFGIAYRLGNIIKWTL